MDMSPAAKIQAEVLTLLHRVSRHPINPTPTSALVDDLGFDSLQVLEVVEELEEKFDISIPLNDVPSIRTVAQVVERVMSLVGEKARA